MVDDFLRLPLLLAEIEAIVGRAAAIKIAASYGGTPKEFPSSEKMTKYPHLYADNWLVQVVGFDAALKLCKEMFPIGCRVEIPTAGTVLRRIYIIENSVQLSEADLATALGLHIRSVRKIRSQLRERGLIA